MNSTLGAPFGARTGAGHAGVDSSAVRPITPGKGVPDGYSFSGMATLLFAVDHADPRADGARTYHPEGMILRAGLARRRAAWRARRRAGAGSLPMSRAPSAPGVPRRRRSASA